MRILVVEDEIALGHTLCRCLEEEGYMSDVARDGVEGLALLKQAPTI